VKRGNIRETLCVYYQLYCSEPFSPTATTISTVEDGLIQQENVSIYSAIIVTYNNRYRLYLYLR
jgi:hypothetical protein